MCNIYLIMQIKGPLKIFGENALSFFEERGIDILDGLLYLSLMALVVTALSTYVKIGAEDNPDVKKTNIIRNLDVIIISTVFLCIYVYRHLL